MATQDFPTPSWKEPVFPEDDRTFVDFIGVGNSINFAFTDFATGNSFTVAYRGTTWRGAFGMWASLRRALDGGLDILSGEFLRALDCEAVKELFLAEHMIPMLRERCRILREIGSILCSRYQGRFWNLIHDSDGTAFGERGIVTQLLEAFPCFRDETVHRPTGYLLKFEKRAQLFAMMYQGRALSSKTLIPLSDSEDLGPIADYSVPRCLRAIGVLKYSAKLETDIASGREIPEGSIAEQEIRAQTVRAQLLLRDAINRLRASPIDFIKLDFKLWSLGRSVKTRHHLTRTTAY